MGNLLTFESRVKCRDGSNCTLRKNVIFEFLLRSANTQTISFSCERFEDTLNFIKQYDNESACIYTTKCRNGTILRLLLEDEAQQLLKKTLERNEYTNKYVYAMYSNIDFLFKMLKLIKEIDQIDYIRGI